MFFREHELLDGPAFDEMFLNDALEHCGSHRVIPRALWINHRNRSLVTDAKAIRLRTINGVFRSRESQFLQSLFQVIPRSEAFFFRGAFRLRLIRAQENVTVDLFNPQLLDEVSEPFGRFRSQFHASYHKRWRSACSVDMGGHCRRSLLWPGKLPVGEAMATPVAPVVS